MTDLDATTRLTAAVAALTEPTTHNLRRADPAADPHAARLNADDRAHDRELAARHAHYLRAGHHAQAARTLQALIDHRTRVIQRRQRAADTTAAEPSLLDQLRTEIGASNNTGAGGSAGPYRSIIAIPAAELLAAIQRHVGARPDDPLPSKVRHWADAAADAEQAAATAEQWAAKIRSLLNPPKRWHHPGACPDCGHRIAHVADDSGQEVRRPAIEFDRTRGRARCLRCPARWETEAQLRQLARVLIEQQEHRHDHQIIWTPS